jgi:hypothetical protein
MEPNLHPQRTFLDLLDAVINTDVDYRLGKASAIASFLEHTQ